MVRLLFPWAELMHCFSAALERKTECDKRFMSDTSRIRAFWPNRTGAQGTNGETTSIYGDGVKQEFREFIKSFRPLQRMGTPDDVANVAEYLAGNLAAFVSGQPLPIAGGAPA